jgi:peptide methionine sulfoxide reductase msrA/msrB
MKNIILMACLIIAGSGCAQNRPKIAEQMNDQTNPFYHPLTKEEEEVIVYKQTERPFTGKYDDFYEEGTFVCKRCGAELYRSKDKFNAGCGWPAFDDEIKGAIKRVPDADGSRTEIECTKCGAHLGHVFNGEGLTPKNTRNCVNSISLGFIPFNPNKTASYDTAYFAGGCFWGVEYFMHKIDGVISTEVGYTGGHLDHPSYKDVCTHTTGHAETVRVIFDTRKTDYESVAKMFFEIHDPTQVDGQGPDIGDQYRSEVFYNNNSQRVIAEKLISILEQKGLSIATRVDPVTAFWKAEDYHQQYYEKAGETPYCHGYTKRF